MATIQSTSLVVKVEPRWVQAEYDFGPSASMAANGVLLTRESLRTLGAYPPISGGDWDCLLHVYQVVAGVETAVDMSNFSISGVYWDAVIQTAVTLRLSDSGAASGYITVSFADGDAPVVGMYNFAIRAVDKTSMDIHELMSGKLEILPATPTV